MSSQSIKELCQLTKQSFNEISVASSELKNNTLQSILKNIDLLRSEIIVANKKTPLTAPIPKHIKKIILWD